MSAAWERAVILDDLDVPEVEFVRDVVPMGEGDGEIRYPVHHCGGPIMPTEAAGGLVPKSCASGQGWCICGRCYALMSGDDLMRAKAMRAWRAERGEL